jgi:predicted lipoprotein with Yx(FWY)xxD motif
MRYLPIPRLALASVLLAALAFSACTDEDATELEPMTEEPAEAVEPEGAEPAEMNGVQLDVAQQEPYGAYLTDAEGRTLYLFTADTQGQSSACYDACADAWPPLLADNEPSVAAPSLDAALLGTIERRDGSMQVTYNGWPLYYYQRDEGAGQVTGQDIHSFGGEWYLVSPQGETIEAEAEGGTP